MLELYHNHARTVTVLIFGIVPAILNLLYQQFFEVEMFLEELFLILILNEIDDVLNLIIAPKIIAQN